MAKIYSGTANLNRILESGVMAAQVAVGLLNSGTAVVALPHDAEEGVVGIICGINLAKVPAEVVEAALHLAMLLETPTKILDSVRIAIKQAQSTPEEKEVEFRFL
jgi:hypothetical protein